MTKLAEAFRYQARACASLGSPFMERLCLALADILRPGSPLTDRLFDWPGDLSPRAESVPLRVAGALHALRLRGDAGLAAVYPPQAPDEATFRAALSEVFEREAAFIDRFIDSAPQTNEVRRSGALIPLGHLLGGRFDVGWRTSELGASAGLNLKWDHYALKIGEKRFGPAEAALTLRPEWTGPLPPDTPLRVEERRGVDLNPIDPHAEAERLRAYLWPDQPERLRLTDAAIAIAGEPPDRGDAVDWLLPRLGHIAGQGHLIYSTVAWQYFPPEKREEGRLAIERAGEKATEESPLAWFTMENDGGERGAALTLRLWPGNETYALGRADFHGRWVAWEAPLSL